MKRPKEKSFGDYREEGHLWVTLSTGEYYPDVLPLACELYKPVLVTFGQLLKSAHSSTDLFLAIAGTSPQWMRIQLSRVFRKYVSPDTPVEMLKKKSAAKEICDRFGRGFRAVNEVQSHFSSRPMPDEALCAVLWEYKDRGQKGYDLTERLFTPKLSDFYLFSNSFVHKAFKKPFIKHVVSYYKGLKGSDTAFPGKCVPHNVDMVRQRENLGMVVP